MKINTHNIQILLTPNINYSFYCLMFVCKAIYAALNIVCSSNAFAFFPKLLEWFRGS